MSMRLVHAVRTAGPAGLGAGAERLFDDGLHGACTATAFDAATEATVNLPGIARKIVLRRTDGAADILVAEDVAGTDNHETEDPSLVLNHQIFKAAARSKRKNAFFKQFQTARRASLD